jgi:hypothetical protein
MENCWRSKTHLREKNIAMNPTMMRWLPQISVSDLYGEPHEPNRPPIQHYLDQWLTMVDEVVEKYQPDLIWFDFELGTVIPIHRTGGCLRRFTIGPPNTAADLDLLAIQTQYVIW